MGLFDFIIKPIWKEIDEDKALKLVEKTTNQKALMKVALWGSGCETRKVAIAKITNVEYLKKIHKHINWELPSWIIEKIEKEALSIGSDLIGGNAQMQMIFQEQNRVDFKERETDEYKNLYLKYDEFARSEAEKRLKELGQ
jgi:1-deoxy-D-xylulose 5-phosphate reductoisomerase